jgi:hypothetical protein
VQAAFEVVVLQSVQAVPAQVEPEHFPVSQEVFLVQVDPGQAARAGDANSRAIQNIVNEYIHFIQVNFLEKRLKIFCLIYKIIEEFESCNVVF